MPKCDCGVESARTISRFDEKGDVRQTICPHCSPGSFEIFTVDKLVPGYIAMPNMYKTYSDGIMRAKDELTADTVAKWDNGPTARAIANKRATRRTEPMTQSEIERAVNIGKEWARSRGY